MHNFHRVSNRQSTHSQLIRQHFYSVSKTLNFVINFFHPRNQFRPCSDSPPNIRHKLPGGMNRTRTILHLVESIHPATNTLCLNSNSNNSSNYNKYSNS
jgi:hypothetical protein